MKNLPSKKHYCYKIHNGSSASHPFYKQPRYMDYPPHPPAFNLDPPLTIFQKSQHLNPRISKGDSHYVNVYD